jgi:hypothetical protein
LIFKTTNVNISCLFTSSYTVIKHARDWHKRSRNPGSLTTDDTARNLVIARNQLIEDRPLKHGGTEEAERIRRIAGPDIARAA